MVIVVFRLKVSHWPLWILTAIDFLNSIGADKTTQ